MHPLNSKLFFLLLVNRPKRAAASVVVAEHWYNQRGRSPEASFRLSIAFEQKKKQAYMFDQVQFRPTSEDVPLWTEI